MFCLYFSTLSEPSYGVPPRSTTPKSAQTSSSPSVFKPPATSSQSQLGPQESKNGVPLPNPPRDQGGRQRNGYRGAGTPPSFPGEPTWGLSAKDIHQKTAHFEPISRPPPQPQQQVTYTQPVFPSRQQSSSSGNYFFPSQPNAGTQPTRKEAYANVERPKPYPDKGNGNGDNLSKSKLRWGSSRESLDDPSTPTKELPVLEIGTTDGKPGTTSDPSKKGSSEKEKDSRKGKPSSGPGDKYGRPGSYREAQREKDRSGKPSKSPRTHRRPHGESGHEKNKRYSADNPAFVREMGVDVPNESTPKDKEGGYSSHNTSRDERSSRGREEPSNFHRRNSSRTRRGSKRRDHGSRGSSSERGHRERSNSRGKLGYDDSTTLDYVRGVPIDRDSRRKAGSKPSQSAASDDERRRHRDREGDARGRHYASDDSRPHKKYETPDSSSPSDLTGSDPHHQDRHHHRGHGGVPNEAYEEERAMTPKHGRQKGEDAVTPEEFLNSKDVQDAKNMNFTININAQPGSAVQIALGHKQLPTPRPMITATPLKAEVRTTMPGMSEA